MVWIFGGTEGRSRPSLAFATPAHPCAMAAPGLPALHCTCASLHNGSSRAYCPPLHLCIPAQWQLPGFLPSTAPVHPCTMAAPGLPALRCTCASLHNGSSRASCPPLHLCIPAQWNLTCGRLGSHPVHIRHTKKPPYRWFVCMVGRRESNPQDFINLRELLFLL